MELCYHTTCAGESVCIVCRLLTDDALQSLSALAFITLSFPFLTLCPFNQLTRGLTGLRTSLGSLV